MKKSSLLLAALVVSCCAFGDMREERKSAAYQAAMTDYSAGRLDAAIAGFEKLLKTEGDNASARFQLACLLQDYRRDWIGAICNYREYLRLEPKSDKAALGQERIALCEKELAKELAAKYGISGEAASLESERIRKELDESERKINESLKALEEAELRMTRLEQENKRLRRQLTRMDFGHADKTKEYEEEKARSISVNDLLGGDEDEPISLPEGVKEDEDGAQSASAIPKAKIEDDSEDKANKIVINPSAAEEEDSSGPKSKISRAAYIEEDDDTSSLRAGLAAAKEIVEEDESGPVLFEGEERKPAETKLSEFVQSQQPKAPERPSSRPKTYVVQEGDTLYAIALKFYGRKGEWKTIRDANKATISTDGRVRAGETIILP